MPQHTKLLYYEVTQLGTNYCQDMNFFVISKRSMFFFYILHLIIRDCKGKYTVGHCIVCLLYTLFQAHNLLLVILKINLAVELSLDVCLSFKYVN